MIDQKKVGLLIGSFVLILIAIVILQSSADVVADSTDIKQTGNVSVTITSGSGSIATTSQRLTSLVFFGNATNNSNINAGIAFGSTVNFTRNGTIRVTQVLNVSGGGGGEGIVFGNGAYLVQANYEGTNYISDSSARSTTRLIPLFLALAIMSVAVGMAYLGFKDELGNMF